MNDGNAEETGCSRWWWWGFSTYDSAGGTLPTLGGGFLIVTTFSLFRAGPLGVLTIWGGVTEPLAPIFMAALLFPFKQRGEKT